jgi:hypothetical protein
VHQGGADPVAEDVAGSGTGDVRNFLPTLVARLR